MRHVTQVRGSHRTCRVNGEGKGASPDVLRERKQTIVGHGSERLGAQVCVGCQKVSCILLHGAVCIISHHAHLRG